VADTLRIGLLLDGELAPAWLVRLLARLAALEGIEIALVLTSEDLPRTQPEDVGDWDGASYSGAWRLWRTFERRLYRASARNFELRPLPSELRGVERLSIPAGADASAAPMSMLRHLRSLALDVLVQFGLPEWGVPLCGVARFGLWRVRSGDRRRGRRGPPGFWEVVRAEGATVACLEMLTPDALDGQVLAEGAFTSDDHSVRQNRDAHYGAAGGLLLRELASLQRRGEEAWRIAVAGRQGGVVPNTGSPVQVPDLFSATLGAARVYGRVLARKVRARLMREQWLLMYSFASKDAPDTRFERFRRITPPKDRIWADPFVVQRRGRWYVFFEEMLHREGRGVLSCLELRADGGWTEPRRVLERPYHLSYPNVFEHEGEWYMLPETHEARCVELYRALEFPWRWEKVATLLQDVVLVDATLWQADGRWWLFGNTRAHPDMSLQDGLCLFSTDDLLAGQWTAHPGNPVVLDATSARPAGRLWQHEGRLLRPSQDSTTHYGYALRINEVEVLSPTDYRERCLQRLEPDWARDLIGVHTISFAGGLTVIDVLRRHWR
jgi:hypothetical protein